MGWDKAQTEEAGNVGAGRSLMVAGVLILLDRRWHGILAATFEWQPACLLRSSFRFLFASHASITAVTTVAIPASLDVRLNVWDIRDGIRNIFGEESFY